MGNLCSSSSEDPYLEEKVEVLDPETALEKDPNANFASFVERRFMVFAIHPVTGERLRAQLIRKNVDQLEDDDGDGSGFHVRWGRYWLKEPGSDVIIREIDDVESFDKTPSALFNHYLSFVQSVGTPAFEYKKHEDIYCRDHTDQWHHSIVLSKEKDYYYIKYQDSKELPSEWIHKFSTRLRKVPRYDGRQMDSADPWDSFYELDWIRVRHPTNNQYLPAKIISKEQQPRKIGVDRTMLVQYEDPSLLIRQETLSERLLRKDTKKVEHYNRWKRRWRYNRLYIYSGALKAVGLVVHPMSNENAHSLFRALSHQLFGTEENFQYLRLKCLEHVSQHKDYYANFVDINFEYYLAHKRKGVTGEWFSMGDHLDIQAVCELYDARVEIYSELSPKPLETVRFYQQMKSLPLIRLSYRGSDHYDSVSHMDSPLPIVVEKNLRRVPLGTVLTQQKIILTARNDQFELVRNRAKKEKEKHYREVLMYKVRGYVEFPKQEIYTRLKQLLEEVQLDGAVSKTDITDEMSYDDSRASHRVRHDRQVMFELANNRNIRIAYPSEPYIEPEEDEARARGRARGGGFRGGAAAGAEEEKKVPLMTIEGLKKLVDVAMAFVKKYSPQTEWEVLAVSSRMQSLVPVVKARSEDEEDLGMGGLEVLLEKEEDDDEDSD